MTGVRIRGIYATALTQHLRESVRIVQPSYPIERRFDVEFPVGPHDTAVDTTRDRQGVGIAGAPEVVSRIRDRLHVAVDSFSWEDHAPEGAVFRAVVTEEVRRGVIVDLGPREGFLPADAAGSPIAVDDELRVQVRDPAPPWANSRPDVSTVLVADGGLVQLVRGGSAVEAAVGDPERETELVRLTEVLPTDVPTGWGVRWLPAAVNAAMDDLAVALELAADRASSIEAIAETVETQTGGWPDERDAAWPVATSWVWFGRDSRFVLDDIRREVTSTMPGHHRLKAAADAASAAVDFCEDLCDPSGSFPFELTARHFGPDVHDDIRIDHGKPDGRRFSLGTGTVTGRSADTVTVRREMTPGGEYDALGVPRARGDTATTKFKEGRWWYPTVYRSDVGEVKGTYVNVCTPVELFPHAATYVDLHVDVIRHADGTVERVDDDDLDRAVDRGTVTAALAEKARAVATAIERGLAG